MTKQEVVSKTNTYKVADLLREGMKILCIKDHVRSSINDSLERIRAITNTSFVVGRLN